MTTIGIVFPPNQPPERLQNIAVATESVGLEELWVWEDCFAESGLASAAAVLAWTNRILVGISLLPVPLRNVALSAMEIATIARLFPGRLMPGIARRQRAGAAAGGCRRGGSLAVRSSEQRSDRVAVSRMAAGEEPRRGTFANGMEFLTWGAGPRTLLFIQSGPGSGLPRGNGFMARMSRRWFDPFVETGFAVWIVTRRRNMPPGHTVADMADDYAGLIADEFGGRVDLLVGESYGGMIAQHLAARDGALGVVAIVVAAAEVNARGKEVDSRVAAALTRGDTAGAGIVLAEYVLPGRRAAWIRRVVGPWIGRSLLSGGDYPSSDILVETEAEIGFDSRAVLPMIRVPVVLLCGDRDQFFPPSVVHETVGLIPDCTLVTYEGKGHLRVASSRRVAHDVLAFVQQHPAG